MKMKKIFTVLLVFATSACFGGYSPNSKFYNLQPVAEVQPVSGGRWSIGVNEVDLPEYLEKPQIVAFEEGTPQMKISELNRWGEPLGSMIQRMVAADVSAYLPFSEVKTRSQLTEKFNYVIDIQIVRFDMILNDKAVLEAWWYVSTPNKILYKQKIVLSEKIGSGFDAFAEAESRMIGQMSRDIALQIAKFKS